MTNPLGHQPITLSTSHDAADEVSANGFDLRSAAKLARQSGGDGPFPYAYLIDIDRDGDLEPVYMTIYEDVDWIEKAQSGLGGKGAGYNDGVFFYVPRALLTPDQLADQQAWEEEQRQNGEGGRIMGENSARLKNEVDDYVVVAWGPTNMDAVRKSRVGGDTSKELPVYEAQTSYGKDDSVPNEVQIFEDGTWSYTNNRVITKDVYTKIMATGAISKEDIERAEQAGADHIGVASGRIGSKPVYILQERHNRLRSMPRGLEPDLDHTSFGGLLETKQPETAGSK